MKGLRYLLLKTAKLTVISRHADAQLEDPKGSHEKIGSKFFKSIPQGNDSFCTIESK